MDESSRPCSGSNSDAAREHSRPLTSSFVIAPSSPPISWHPGKHSHERMPRTPRGSRANTRVPQELDSHSLTRSSLPPSELQAGVDSPSHKFASNRGRHLMSTIPSTGQRSCSTGDSRAMSWTRITSPSKQASGLGQSARLRGNTPTSPKQLLAHEGGKGVSAVEDCLAQTCGKSTVELDQSPVKGYVAYSRFHGSPSPWRFADDGLVLMTFPQKPRPRGPSAPPVTATRCGPWFSSDKRFSSTHASIYPRQPTFTRAQRTNSDSGITFVRAGTNGQDR
eukprot:TRINITY_DN34783_c0_g1_i1.p1 TRINITY_DN34783_c0_g1~~TRINITY_DN34783_c0_g1_i1.p1  ORF type:complete len:279 (-),score=18.40 TRINITY_DN34783_c0_g1_i1:159-995(-)